MVHSTPVERLFVALGLICPDLAREYPFHQLRPGSETISDFCDFYLARGGDISTDYNEAIVSRIDYMKCPYQESAVRHEFLLITAHPTLAHWNRQESIKVVLERCSVLPAPQDTLGRASAISSVAVGGSIRAQDSISLWDPNTSHFAKSVPHVTFGVIPNETPFGVQEEIPPGTLPFFVLVLAAKRTHDVLGKYELTGHDCFLWCRAVTEVAATFAGRPLSIQQQIERSPADTSPLATGLLTHSRSTLGKCYSVAAGTTVTEDAILRDIIASLREDIKRVGREKEDFCDDSYVHRKRAMARGKQVSRLRAAEGGEERVRFDAPVGVAGSSALGAPPGGTKSGADDKTQKAKGGVKKAIQKFRSRVWKGSIWGADK
ncbi:hypothetical protein P691DRAFT_754901 [Macrolepiota fuliginosa MF-IS2]|uniref:Uncharacterized protein n=1 Tax=Macrolepiota fuliginosa MF-IS2 TaxID=1400762 RepID=A0A9P5XR07_9AGAR|nr:hypothetical protein P691DRAFT_754901 [Macrolepiota fuliginosa MF-IS2]